jgi:hypothetical protein
MTDDGKTAELQRITGDLERFVETYCARAPGAASDFADEKCNDAFLMLREALDNLQQRD